MKEQKVEEEVEFVNKRYAIAILITIVVIIILIIFFNKVIPNIENSRLAKEQICQNLCIKKNMTYYGVNVEQNCLCNYKGEEGLAPRIVGLIQENNSTKEPEPLIMTRADGTKFTCTMNRTTKSFRCEDIK